MHEQREIPKSLGRAGESRRESGHSSLEQPLASDVTAVSFGQACVSVQTGPEGLHVALLWPCVDPKGHTMRGLAALMQNK